VVIRRIVIVVIVIVVDILAAITITLVYAQVNITSVVAAMPAVGRSP
jgi:hypothetical protein